MARALTEGTANHDADRADRGRRAARRVAPRRGRLGRPVDQRRGPGRAALARRWRSPPRSPLEPTFPAAEVERLRDERLNDLLQAKADPRRRADDGFVETIYAAGLALWPAVGGHGGDRPGPRRRRHAGDPPPPPRPEPDDAHRRRRPRGGRRGRPVRSPKPASAAWAPNPDAEAPSTPHVRAARDGADRSGHPSAGLGPDRDPGRPRRPAPARSRTSTRSRS